MQQENFVQDAISSLGLGEALLLGLNGGQRVESTRDDVRLTTQLTTISAAVIGVIVNLAMFFAQHVFHTERPLLAWDFAAWHSPRWLALRCCVSRAGTISLLAACALASLVVSYLR